MKKILTLGIISLSILACGSPDEKDASFEKNECVSAGEAYYVETVEVDGNCGHMPSQVIVIPEDGNITIEGFDCNSKPDYDGCEVFVDMSCVGNVDGYRLEMNQTGKVVWAEDGSEGAGLMTIGLSVEGYSCVSTYEYFATRI